MLIKNKIRRWFFKSVLFEHEKSNLLLGKLMSRQVKTLPPSTPLQDAEFRVFSQWGDDGIIQFLIHHALISNRYFIEFGVEDYTECNTRFLLFNDNWSGLIMDGSPTFMKKVQKSDLYWRYDLRARAELITAENINEIFKEEEVPHQPGLLHIDIDGMDYWVWKSLDRIRPNVVVAEYNSVFGFDRAITVPYQADFYRTRAHYSNLYWGASFKALCFLAKEKGYAFVGCNQAGNNAYFVDRACLGPLQELSSDAGYSSSKYRESRNQKGKLTYLSGSERLGAIQGLQVWNVESSAMETL